MPAWMALDEAEKGIASSTNNDDFSLTTQWSLQWS